MDGNQVLMIARSFISHLTILSLISVSCGTIPQFDSARAYDDLERICSFGPRVANTESHLKAGEFIHNTLKATTEICRIQKFTVYDSLLGSDRHMFNIIASYYPDAEKRILLCSHWDSRPLSEKDPDSSKIDMPILGANDGVSGVAILLEIARILKDHRPPVGVDIALFDGEDYGTDGWPGGWFLGSKYFAETMKGYGPRIAILLDMVGDTDLQIYREVISEKYAKDLNDFIWTIAFETGSVAFIDSVKHTVSDDHVPLLLAGIKAVDIIDFDYPYWHTQQDTPDKCSPQSLDDVGRVIVAAIFDSRIKDF